MKPKKQDAKIIGYVIDYGSILPVFLSEKDSVKGRIYKTVQEAKEHLK